jgi:hypothetical protein
MTAHKKTRDRRRAANNFADWGWLCARCDEPNDRVPQRYCRACHALYMREYRASRVVVVVSRETFCSTRTGRQILKRMAR